jgi:hypothetical protein
MGTMNFRAARPLALAAAALLLLLAPPAALAQTQSLGRNCQGTLGTPTAVTIAVRARHTHSPRPFPRTSVSSLRAGG